MLQLRREVRRTCGRYAAYSVRLILATGIFTVSGFAAQGPVCVNKCGDGTCQEIVCMGSGCPCPETAEACPQDCGDADEKI